MILTCPNCSTRYLTKPEAIGENGRMVRCSKCENTWFVTVEPDALALEDQIAPEMTVIDEPPQIDDQPDAITEPPNYDQEIERGAHVSIRDMADKKRRTQRIFGVAMIWATTLGLLALAAVLAFLFRQPIVEKFPQTAAIYNVFNIQASPTGLMLDPIQTEYIQVEGVQRLLVNGSVQNLTQSEKIIPMVKLSILNRSDEEIVHWFVQPIPSIVGPKDRVEFATEYPNPPVDAASLTYVLSPEEG